MASILVTGGTGLIGKHLCNLLSKKGHKVLILSRNSSNNPNVFKWDIENNYIDENAIKNIDFIIHLAGEGIADKRWTSDRKKLLIKSRVASANLLFKKVKELNPNLKGFISASGIGYYGAITSEEIFDENSASGNDFLSTICVQWEEASLQFNLLNIRTVLLRTGVVLTKKGGALEIIIMPIKFGLGAALGSGKQYMPWIHIDDLCEMYLQAIENTKLKGIYNAVAPEHCTNNTLSKAIAKVLNKPFFLPNIPAFLLKIVLGKLSCILLEGSKVSSKKIEETGFKFQFSNLNDALKNLLNN
ncbi:TIGR01777 family oxidoreductase [Lutibacter sp.]|uniref:TIGR01777 family oxidoreductase n=1 Tax=Lutibacter sp. TaxID=1925666 RepID=UPI001A360ADF|nr:TIGR01777 family oxidoreductase [Lutibacter sp.]MBI9042141.1 TIGR01777 family oxidoreductase [Lutibacter sp.]